MTLFQAACTEAIPYIIILVGLALTVLFDSYISRSHKRIFLLVVLLTGTLILQNVADTVLSGTPNLLVRKLLVIYGYSIRPAIIVLFYHFLKNKKAIVPAWSLVGLNAALYLTALFSPLTFSFNETTYVFTRGPLGFTCHVIGAILLAGLLLQVLFEYRSQKKEMIFPIASILFIAAGVVLDVVLPIWRVSALSALTIAIVISCSFVYIWFHMQFVKSYQESLITQQRIKTMMSQIQPHFLYNTIATFRALCKRDPEKAALVAEKFAQYLRKNLDLLESNDLIPIEKEMEHTKVYTDIEMVRFENIRIEYDIQDTSFSVPPLSVQPIVENAIRHGVRTREEGLVCVAARRLAAAHEIVIRDNGIGFDVSDADRGDGAHIGLNNVRERIERQCGGTLTVESEPGKGTTVTICIPETEMKK